jgi:hypothetical protein
MSDFLKELDDISQTQWKTIYEQLKDINNIIGLKMLVEPLEVLNLLEKYNLDSKIEFILEIESGDGKMKHYYNGMEIKPDGKYIGVERDASLLEILTECTLQNKHDPDIKHLQVNSLQNKRGNQLEKILRNNEYKSN